MFSFSLNLFYLSSMNITYLLSLVFHGMIAQKILCKPVLNKQLEQY